MKISVADFWVPIGASVFKFCVHLQVGKECFVNENKDAKAHFAFFLSPDPKRIGGYSDQPGVRPCDRLSVRLSVRRQKLVRSITFIPFEIF